MSRKPKRPAPELLIQKTRQALRLALIEKQLAKQISEMTSPKEERPTSPDNWEMSRQSGELLTAARRYACLEHCLNNEILWMNSAWAMYQALLPEDPQDVDVLFPQDHFWIEFETPKLTPVGEMAALFLIDRDDLDLLVEVGPYFNPDRPQSRAEKQAYKRILQTRELERQAQGIPKEHWIELNVVNSSGSISWSIALVYDEGENTICWHFTHGYACPTGECQTLARELQQETISEVIPACAHCQHAVDFFQVWFGIAYHMIQGDFQETASFDTEREDLVVTEESDTPQPARSPKNQVAKRQHSMHVIRFDASVKRDAAQTRSKRGAWMTGRAEASVDCLVEDTAIIYVKMKFSEHERTFTHERYKAARYTTRSFEANIRPQPMTVREYKARITADEVSPDGILQAKQKKPGRRILQIRASKYE